MYSLHNFPSREIATSSLLNKNNKNKKNTIILHQNLNLYIVRHGISEHNVFYTGDRKDTKLLPEGQEKLYLSTTFLPSDFDYLFVSPLLRSRQTLFYLLQKKHEEDEELTHVEKKRREMLILEAVSEIKEPERCSCNYPDAVNQNLPEEYFQNWNYQFICSDDFIISILKVVQIKEGMKK